VGFHSCARGNAEPSALDQAQTTSSRKASWINTINLDLDYWPGINESTPRPLRIITPRDFARYSSFS
jgi:hypothetical protein